MTTAPRFQAQLSHPTPRPAPQVPSCAPGGLALLGKAIAQLGVGLAGISCGGDLSTRDSRY